jgi:prophage regulatory protein
MPFKKKVPAQNEKQTKPSFLRMPAVLARVPFNKAQLYRMIADGQFPRQICLGTRAVAWLESEIDQWCAERIEKRDSLSEAQEVAREIPRNAYRKSQERRSADSPEAA